nr:hypothetical protein [Methylobacterium sp. ZNC0032]
MSAAAPRREDLPDGSVRIHFATPIVGIGGEAKLSCDFRCPTVGELIDLGDPRALVMSADGVGTDYVDRIALRRWGEKLIVGHDFDVLSRERDLRLGMLIEGALLGFFENARSSLKAGSAPSPNEATASQPSKT